MTLEEIGEKFGLPVRGSQIKEKAIRS